MALSKSMIMAALGFHTEIDDGHSSALADVILASLPRMGTLNFLENLYILVEVGQQNVLSKILQVTLCVTGQPIGYDFFFVFIRFH